MEVALCRRKYRKVVKLKSCLPYRLSSDPRPLGRFRKTPVTPHQTLQAAFAQALGIPITSVTPDLAYRAIPQWDSVAHMALIAELESTFNVMLDTDEILDLSSVAVAKQILGRHGVAFDAEG